MLTTTLPLVLLASFMPGSLAATYEVSVGQGGLVFSPNTVSAQAGDTVHFTFFPKAHSVTQSSFDAPCVPFNGGFDSGLMPTNDTDTVRPQFSLAVNDTSEKLVFCKQTNGNHCGNGMVFILNPSEHTFDQFQAQAKALGASSAAASSSAYATPPPQSWAEATATVSNSGSTWTSVYTSYAGSPAPTYGAAPVDHKITVGQNGQLAFSPNNISAAIGDTVTFTFFPKNHTVTQSSFSAPCVPLQDSTGKAGIDSGFMPVSDPSATKTFTVTVNDTAPIWIHCKQTVGNHCGNGMVASINAVESGPNNFQAFQDLAKRINGSSSTTSAQGGSSTGDSKGNSAMMMMTLPPFSTYGLLLAALAALVGSF